MRRFAIWWWVLLPACSFHDPHVVVEPPQPVVGSSADGDVVVTWRRSDPADAGPTIEVGVWDVHHANGRTWEEVERITLLDEEWGPIASSIPSQAGDDRAVDRFASFVVPGRPEPLLLHVLIDRSGAPQQTATVRLTMAEIRVPPAPGHETQSRGAAALATYPLWGLPRDLLDAPITALNRLGLGRTTRCTATGRTCPDSLGFIFAPAMVGTGWGAVWGFHEAGTHYLKSALFTAGGAAFGAVVGLAAGIALDASWAYVVDPLQTGLLRTGIDREYLKANDSTIRLAGDWTDDDVRRYETQVRSYAFFPNWNYGAHDTRYTLPPADDAPSLWTVEGIEIVE